MTKPHRDEPVEPRSCYGAWRIRRTRASCRARCLKLSFLRDLSSLGAPGGTLSREAWCHRAKQAFAPIGMKHPGPTSSRA